MLLFAMDARYRELEAENGRLRARVAELEAAMATGEKRLERLLATVEKLKAALEEAQRSAQRQAAPFRKGEAPKRKPKKPGRKSGKRHGAHRHRIRPPRIDERYDVALPEACSHCGSGHVVETGIQTQYQTEIPRRPIYRQFDIHVGSCQDCGHRVQERHELQTSDALGAAASQLGPDAHGALVLLNKELGLSHGKCARVFETLFGIAIARATSARSMLRSAQLAEPAYRQLRCDIRGSPWVGPDETGWRVGGTNAWLHGFVSETATCYEIGNRSGEIAQRLLGLDWSGTLIHDGWSVYDQFEHAFHQQCLGHLQRRCTRLLETAVGAAVRLPRAVLQRLEKAFALRRAWRGHRLSADELAAGGLALACDLQELVSGRFTCAANRRLAAHIRNHAMHWFWFLIDPTIDATNYRSEQAMRPAVVNRKVWGGNRTWTGARAQGVLLSVTRTLVQRGHDLLQWLSLLRRRKGRILLPPAAR